ncbi:MAG: cation transporter [Porcipelethomonas sp.]
MEQTKNTEKYKSQQRVSFFTFLSELPNFFAVLVSAIFSGSLIVWMDFVDSLGNVINAGFVTLLSRKLRHDLKYEYNYGIGKIEAISSLCCNGILICGLIFMLISSVNDLISPKQPSGVLIYVVVLKVINVAFDSYFLAAQYKIKKSSGSSISVSQFHASLKSFSFDAIALVSILICWLFRDFNIVWYFSPVICIALSVFFFAETIADARKSIRVLTDRTLPEKEQMQILNVISKFYDRYVDFDFVSSHMSGETVYIDLRLIFREETTFAEIRRLCSEISDAMNKQIENSKVSIIIDAGITEANTETKKEKE